MIRQAADTGVWRINSAGQSSILLVMSGTTEQGGVLLVMRSGAAVMSEGTDITTDKDVCGCEDPALDTPSWAAG